MSYMDTTPRVTTVMMTPERPSSEAASVRVPYSACAKRTPRMDTITVPNYFPGAEGGGPPFNLKIKNCR